MFIAHLPAGYILTKKLSDRYRIRKYFWLGLVASVLPDIDLIWFYPVDHRRVLHHAYWTHLPMFWLIMSILWVIFLESVNRLNDNLKFATIIFFAGIFLHFVLDTVAGGIMWFYPFLNTKYVLIHVPTRYTWWIQNFIFHWSFLLEIAIFIWAIIVLLRSKHT